MNPRLGIAAAARRLARRWAFLVIPCLLTCPPKGQAAPPRPDGAAAARDPGWREALPLPDAGEGSWDPIGLDDSTGRELDRAAVRLEEARRRAQQAAHAQSAQRGDVMTALEAVSEVGHRVEVTLAQGLAFVETELVFASRSNTPAEIAYRLPLPAEAAVYALKACRLSAPKEAPTLGAESWSKTGAARCAAGLSEPSGAPTSRPRVSGDLPHASAHTIHDSKGRAVALRAAALDKSSLIALRVSYVAAAPLHGGVVRFRLPARGYDPRIAPSEISLRASGFDALEPAGTVTLDAHLPCELRAQLSARGPSRNLRSAGLCGGEPCARSYLAAPPAALIARPTWLLLDASPSMEGFARNAADLALSSLLTLLPEASPLRVFSFAARAHELGRFTPDAAPLKRLSDALMADLGASTQPARVLETHEMDLLKERPRVLLLSDGKLDRAALTALAGFAQRGVELWLIALSSEGHLLTGPFSGVIDAAGSVGPALEERLRVALGPRPSSRPLPGEERVQESRPKRRYVPRAGEGWLSHWFSRRAGSRFDTQLAAPAGYIDAPAYEGLPPPPTASPTGLPKESVLSMLRTQLIPEARACLRSDRRGRADYAVSLTFHALFADREAYDVRIEGRIPEPLRACLSGVIGRLRIPTFSGRIRVRYPIHTEREPEPPVVELEGDALEQVNRVIGQ